MRTVAIVLGLIGSMSATARAAPCDDAGGALTERRAHYERARAALAADAARGSRWTWGWGLGFTATATASFAAAALIDDETDRAHLVVGGAKSALGVLSTFVLSPHWYDVPTDTPSPTCADLIAIDAALAAAARRQRVDWRHHAQILAVQTAGFLVIGIGYDDWARAALGAAIGFGIGELQLATRPTRALRRHNTTALAVAPFGAGLLVSGTF